MDLSGTGLIQDRVLAIDARWSVMMELIQFGSLIGLTCVFAGMIVMVSQQPESRHHMRSGVGGLLHKLLTRITQTPKAPDRTGRR